MNPLLFVIMRSLFCIRYHISSLVTYHSLALILDNIFPCQVVGSLGRDREKQYSFGSSANFISLFYPRRVRDVKSTNLGALSRPLTLDFSKITTSPSSVAAYRFYEIREWMTK